MKEDNNYHTLYITFTYRLAMGYVFHPDGKLDTITWTSFELHENGEDGNPPKEFTAKFSAGMGIKCFFY
jgi:hypothetical protein